MKITLSLERTVDAAEKYAEKYDRDDRENIKTDVLNAFYAGVEFGKSLPPNATVSRAHDKLQETWRRLTRRLQRTVMLLRQRFCKHEFAMEDLCLTGDTAHEHRVRWPCSKCGRVYHVHCGMYR